MVETPALRHRPTRVVLLGVALLAPLALSLLFIARYSVDVPVGDQWWTVADTLVKAGTGRLHWSDIVKQANESRPAVPRLVFLAVAWLTGWNTRVEMVLTQLLAWCTAVGAVMIARRTIRMPWAAHLVLAFLITSLLLSPVQHENLVWGVQFIVYIIPACLVACAWVAGTTWSLASKTAFFVVACTVATYSFANGLTLWLLAPWLLISDWRKATRWSRAAFAVAWVGAAAVAFGTYVVGFQRSLAGSSAPILLTHKRAAVHALLLYMGTPLSPWQSQTAFAYPVALVVTALLAMCVGWLLVSRRGRLVAPRALPWLVLVAYALVAGALIVPGRLLYGAEYMLASRYVTHSAWLYVGLLCLLALLLFDGVPAAKLRRGAAVAAAAAVLVLHVTAVRSFLPMYGNLRIQRLQAQAAIWLMPLFPIPEVREKFTNSLKEERALRMARDLDRVGMLRAGLLEAIEPAMREDAEVSNFGVVESVGGNASLGYEVTGWCRSGGGREEPCPAVLLTGTSSGGELPCAVAFPAELRPAVAQSIGADRQDFGWRARITCPGVRRLRAWAVDVQTKSLLLLHVAGNQHGWLSLP